MRDLSRSWRLLLTGHHALNVVSGNHWAVTAIDTTTMMLGLMLVVVAKRLPSQRRERISGELDTEVPVDARTPELQMQEVVSS